MCWHLFTWGDAATVEAPESLRLEMEEMCSRLAEHHRAQPAPAGDRA